MVGLIGGTRDDESQVRTSVQRRHHATFGYVRLVVIVTKMLFLSLSLCLMSYLISFCHRRRVIVLNFVPMHVNELFDCTFEIKKGRYSWISNAAGETQLYCSNIRFFLG